MARTVPVDVYSVTPLFLAIAQRQPGVAVSKINKAIRLGLRRALQHWERELLAERFHEGNRDQFAWPGRTARYEARKMKIKGHNIDMVWSGKTRWTALRSRHFDPKVVSTQTKHRATVRVTMPDYVFMNTRYGYPLARDVVKHTEAEDAILWGIVADVIERELFGSPGAAVGVGA